MELNNVTLHETMQIHEMLNSKTVGITKSKLIQGLVFDQELRALLDKDVQHSFTAINEMINMITRAKEYRKEVIK